MNFPQDIFYEICSYLPTKEIFCILSTVCKDLNQEIMSQNFLNYWQRKSYGISYNLTLEEFTYTLKQFKDNEIINYEAWKTNGGESASEYRNSYSNMWKYTSDCYSSYYEQNQKTPSLRNICCLAYFTGDYQIKDFLSGFYLDVYQIEYKSHSIPEKYKIYGLNQRRALVLDPLKLNFSSYYQINLRLERGIDMLREKIPLKEREYSNTPINKLPIVKKIAIARPLFFTGCVKTMIFLFSNNEVSGDFEEFSIFDNINSVVKAKTIGKIINHVENKKFE